MADYPTDLELNRDKDIHLDDANDLSTVSGQSNMEQSTAISVGGSIREFVGEELSGVNIALLEERILNSLESNPMVDSIGDITVVEYDRRTDSIKIDVEVQGDDNFQMEVSP